MKKIPKAWLKLLEKDKPLFNYGGALGTLPYAQVGNALGGITSAMGVTNDGYQNTGMAGVSGFLSGAGTGASLGSMIMPGIGTAIGAGIGGLASGITNLVAAQKRNKEIDAAKKKEKEYKDKMTLERDQTIVNNFPTQGIVGNDYFAYGGKLPKYLEGGQMHPVAPNVQEAQGATHEEGGITVPDQNGQPLAEIEDQEIVKDGHKVYSDRLQMPGTNQTFAQIAEQIAKNPQYMKIAKKREEADETLADFRKAFHHKNTATRELEKNPDPLDAVFQVQEMMKQMMQMQQQQMQQQQPQPQGASMGTPEDQALAEAAATNPEGVPMAAGGMDLSKLYRGVGTAMPYIDNITNMILTSKTPTIPTPTYTKAPVLNTKFEIGAQLADMNRQGFSRDRSIMQNSNQSNVTRAALLAGGANDMYQKNQLYNTKVNTENELKDKQLMAEYNNRMMNEQKLDNYNLQKMARTDDIHARISANVSDVSENAQFQTSERNKEILDKQKMGLLMMQYMNTGVLDRSGYEKMMEVIEQGGDMSTAMRELQKYKKAKNATPKEAGAVLSPFLQKVLGIPINPANLIPNATRNPTGEWIFDKPN